MATALWIITMAAGAVAMFLWGHMEGRTTAAIESENEWMEGFKEGWEASENFDSSIRMIWEERG